MKRTFIFRMALLFAVTALAHRSSAQSIVASVVTQPCNGNGQISVTATGLTPPISYTYTNYYAGSPIVHANINATTDNLTNIAAYTMQWGNANFWYVQASDGTNQANTTISLNQPFQDSVKVFPGNCPSPNTLQATFWGGTSPYTAVWTNISTSAVYSGNPAQVPDGIYVGVFTDGAGCMMSTPTSTGMIYAQGYSGISANITGSPANCTNGTATVSASGGVTPYTYYWSNAATSQALSGLTMGSYDCIVTDAQGCSSKAYYYVSQSVNITFNSTIGNATCLQNNGTITGFVTGGTAPYTFNWSNGGNTQNLTNLAGGYYQVQITDANGCLGQGYASVGMSTPINVTYNTTASSCTSPTGGATVTPTGGTAPYTVVWNLYPTSVTGVGISNKAAGFYNFVVTDANGCVRTGAAQIPSVSNLSAVMSSNAVVCPATTGAMSVYASGSNTPFTYLWSNAATTATITGVPLGAYSCTITDAMGCSVMKYGSLNQVSTVNVGIVSVPVTCQFATNGALTAMATGGTAPYTYQWSNGPTTPANTGLGMGTYWVTATAANGCSKSVMATVGNSGTSNNCYCTITGTVFVDANNDCVRGASEAGVPNIAVHCSGFGYAYTNANGVYSFQVPSGTYTLSENVQQTYPLASCQSNNQVVTVTAAANCVSTVNFANNMAVVRDLRIVATNMNWPVPGNSYIQRLIVQNDGTTNETNVQLRYAHDGQLTYSTSTPWTLVQPNSTSYPDWYAITSGFPSLNYGTSSASYLYYDVPTNIPVNTMINFEDTVTRQTPVATSWLTDNTPWDNVSSHSAMVVGSYDPNFIEVSPSGTAAPGYILSRDSVLTYAIHFQNTGSYYAQNIVVTDTLDTDLNVKSLRPGYSDHSYSTTVSDNGVVKFTFSNINLPWKSNYGDAMSSGMVTYSIKLKKGLPVGRQIKAKAAIFFDYNSPVITNGTVNTLTTTGVGISEVSQLADGLTLYPNPARDQFSLRFSKAQQGAAAVQLFDLTGRSVLQTDAFLHDGENTLTIATSQLQSGIYLVKISQGMGSATGKIVIAR